VSDPLALIRAVVREELQALHLADVAVVTSVFVHADAGDAHNHACHVKLRESGLELRHVPLTTPHVGMVSPPQVGDLVLLNYLHGDLNRAVVVGRLHSDKVRPPVHGQKSWQVAALPQGETVLTLNDEGQLVLTAGKTQVTLEKDGKVVVTGETDLQIEVKGNAQIKCTDCLIDASGKIDLGSGGAGVITEASHKCYFTGKPLVPSKSVKAKG
jgi:hypothetical protein